MRYLISYSLNKSNKNYLNIDSEIKRLSNGIFLSLSDNCIAIRSDLSINELRNILIKNLSKDDLSEFLIILEIKCNFIHYPSINKQLSYDLFNRF